MTREIFLLAFILDLIMGDPQWLLHPVALIGTFISFLEKTFQKRFLIINKKAKGIILWFLVVIPVYFFSWIILMESFFIHHFFGIMMLIFLSATTLATKSLYVESKKVARALDKDDLEGAQQYLSLIVGRDTQHLGKEGIFRAVIETVAENLSDGIVAPMFYLTIGGLPLAMAYKAVNTLDSMIGYKNEKYKEIGYFCAKIDDLWNWIPSRITGLLIILSSFFLQFNWKKAFSTMHRDGQKHSSPNSGLPEAAMAGSLDIQLGGPNHYFEQAVDKPFIGDNAKEIERIDLNAAWRIMFTSSLFMVFFCLLMLRILGK